MTEGRGVHLPDLTQNAGAARLGGARRRRSLSIHNTVASQLTGTQRCRAASSKRTARVSSASLLARRRRATLAPVATACSTAVRIHGMRASVLALQTTTNCSRCMVAYCATLIFSQPRPFFISLQYRRLRRTRPGGELHFRGGSLLACVWPLAHRRGAQKVR